MLLSDRDRIDAGDHPAYLVKGASGGGVELRPGALGRLGPTTAPSGLSDQDSAPLSLDHAVNEAAREALVRALQRSEGNCIRAARLLGVSRYTVYRMISRFGLTEVRSNRVAS
jgi:transcriptional regulator of acetoin/glycerol metabolism